MPAVLAELSETQFQDYYEQYRRLVYHWAYQWLGSREDAEDAAIAIFVKKWSNRDRFDPAKASFKNWLRHNTQNYCIDQIGKKKFPWIELDENVAAEETTWRTIDRMCFLEAMAKLDSYDRFLLYLKYVEEYTWERLSELYDLEVHILRSQVARLQRTLRAACPD